MPLLAKLVCEGRMKEDSTMTANQTIEWFARSRLPGPFSDIGAARRAHAAWQARMAQPALPDMGIDVATREAVDAAHAEAVRAGHEVIYGPVDEPWGVRRFFVRDPDGVVISVLAHE